MNGILECIEFDSKRNGVQWCIVLESCYLDF